MSHPAFLQQPTIVRLPSLLEEVARGEIRIPRFQRRFVWDNDQRLLLLSSIYLGMPIGSILVWRTRNHDLKSFGRLGALNVTAASAEMKTSQYLLDGFQRVTTLYTALGPGLVSDVDNHDGDESEIAPMEIGEAIRALYFDLAEQSFELEPKRGNVPATWLPLSTLLDPFKLYRFQKSLAGAPGAQTLLHRAETLASTFKDYNILVVPIVSEDLDLVTESFQRVNAAGTRMDLVDMVNALQWTPDFDIHDRMDDIRSKLEEVGWGNIENRTVLSFCKAALDLDLHGTEVREVKEALLGSRNVLDDAAIHLEATAEFLARRCRILGPTVLPYNYQVIMLAEAIRVATADSRELTEETEEALERWLWLTTYGEYFAGINYSRLRETLEHIRLVAHSKHDPRPPLLTKEVGPMGRFDIRRARSKAMLLRMADLEPLGPGGERLDAHRILAEHGKAAAPKLFADSRVGDRSVAGGVENRFIADPRHMRQLRDVLLSGQEDTILRSHGIEKGAAQALMAGDVQRFLALRWLRLAELERAFVQRLGLLYPNSPGNLSASIRGVGRNIRRKEETA